jgi:signal-transduction protein with cAMP-binding, CBS, and nucleotidyltransferase domain
MLRQYTPLAAFSLASYAASTLVRPAPNPVTLNSPAIDVMTDLSQIAAVTIEGSALLASANEYMAARGVRSLFVATPEGRVSGLITAADVLGERPVRVGHARGVGRNELQVADVMTPIDAVAAMRLEDVRAAKVGHIVASLKHAGRQHGLVAEIRSPSEVAIRGIFSATQIARQLGVPLQIPELASTFSEVEQALSAPR